MSRRLGALAFAVLLGTVSAGASRLLRGPSFVDHVAFTNAGPYGLEIEVSGARRDGWMLLGYAPPEAKTLVALVVDQGATWVFRVRAQDVVGPDFTVSRVALAVSGWTVVVPDRVIARLAAQGIPASPALPSSTSGARP